MKFCFLIGHNWTKWSQSISHQKGIMSRMCWRCTKVEYYFPHEHDGKPLMVERRYIKQSSGAKTAFPEALPPIDSEEDTSF